MIYIAKTKWGDVHEAEFRASVNGALIFRSLQWSSAEVCPRFISKEDIEWVQAVCPMTPQMTEAQYNQIVTEKFS